MSLATMLNGMDDVAARAALTNCCAATAWVGGMIARRPFADDAAVHDAADAVWNQTAPADWLEAFAAHPLIGDVDSLRAKYAATRPTAAEEQAGVVGAAEETLRELATLNQAYRDKFGFIFIVFAAGKSAAEMLASLKSRINDSREQELHHAAAEQLKITQLRLSKLASVANGP